MIREELRFVARRIGDHFMVGRGNNYGIGAGNIVWLGRQLDGLLVVDIYAPTDSYFVSEALLPKVVYRHLEQSFGQHSLFPPFLFTAEHCHVQGADRQQAQVQAAYEIRSV